MESNGIRKVYEPSPVPTLYVGRAEDLLGRVPLFLCFLNGNTTSTIPYKYAARQKQAFEFGCADGQGPASRRGSHVYEINTKQKGSADSPGLKHPGALGRPGRPASVLLKRYDKHIPGIYLAYETAD